MKTLLTTGWSFMRIFRLVAGMVALFFAIKGHDAMLGFASAILLVTGILNIGCCGMGGCHVPSPQQKAKIPGKETESISYEEIH